MGSIESVDTNEGFDEALARARMRLEPPRSRERTWPPVAAAAFFALSALVFASAAILAPPAHIAPAAAVRGSF